MPLSLRIVGQSFLGAFEIRALFRVTGAGVDRKLFTFGSSFKLSKVFVFLNWQFKALRLISLPFSFASLWILNSILYKTGKDFDTTDESLAIIAALNPKSNSIFPFNSITHLFFQIHLQNFSATRNTAITLFQLLCFIVLYLSLKMNERINGAELGKVSKFIASLVFSFIATFFFYSRFYLRFPSYDWLNAISLLLFSMLSLVFFIYQNRISVGKLFSTTLIVSPVISIAFFAKPTSAILIIVLLGYYLNNFFTLKRLAGYLVLTGTFSLVWIQVGVLLKVLDSNVYSQFIDGLALPKWFSNNTIHGAVLDVIKLPLYPYYLARNDIELFSILLVLSVIIYTSLICTFRKSLPVTFIRIASTSFISLFYIMLSNSLIPDFTNRALFVTNLMLGITGFILLANREKVLYTDLRPLVIGFLLVFIAFGFGSAHGVGVRSINFVVVIIAIVFMSAPLNSPFHQFKRVKLTILSLIVFFSLSAVFFAASYGAPFRSDLRNSKVEIQLTPKTSLLTTSSKAQLFNGLKECADFYSETDAVFASLFYRTPWFVSIPFRKFAIPVITPTLMGNSGSLPMLVYNSRKFEDYNLIYIALNGDKGQYIVDQNKVMLDTFIEGAGFNEAGYSISEVCRVELDTPRSEIVEGLNSTLILKLSRQLSLAPET
jgi:hypothetical protein